MARYGLATALLYADRLADAQMEIYKILEFQENHPLTCYLLAVTYAEQGKWAEALQFLERLPSSSFEPANGVLASVLKRMGETSRAEKLIRELVPGQAYGSPMGLVYFYFTFGELDKATDWAKKAIRERNPGTAVSLTWQFRSSPRWPELARLMNLPEKTQ